MFGNNINSPFMSPNMSYGPMIQNAPMMSTPIMGMRGPGMMGAAPRNGGFLSSLLGRGSNTGGLLSGATRFNFGNLLNSTSKALGVVKEAIPIVKEVGPMMNNMKSMLKIASIFKDETDTTTNIRNTTISKTSNIAENTVVQNTNSNENDTRITSSTTNITNNNEPNFFL